MNIFIKIIISARVDSAIRTFLSERILIATIILLGQYETTNEPFMKNRCQLFVDTDFMFCNGGRQNLQTYFSRSDLSTYQKNVKILMPHSSYRTWTSATKYCIYVDKSNIYEKKKQVLNPKFLKLFHICR